MGAAHLKWSRRACLSIYTITIVNLTCEDDFVTLMVSLPGALAIYLVLLIEEIAAFQLKFWTAILHLNL